MADPRARPGQPRDRHKERLARPEYDRLRTTIAEVMEAAGITQRELSKKLGMPSSFMNKVMKGTRPLEVTELIDVARALGVGPADLIQKSLYEDEP